MWVAGDLLFDRDDGDPCRLVAGRRTGRGARGPKGGGGAGRDPDPRGPSRRSPRARARGRPKRRARSRRSAGERARGKRDRRPGRRCHRSRRPRRLHRRRRPTRAMERERRDGQRARWLNDQPRLFRREPDAGRDRLTDRDDPVEVRAQVGKGQGARCLGPRGRRRSARATSAPTNGRSIRLPTNRAHRPRAGLDAHHPNVRAQALDRGRDTACQPAAADRHQHETRRRQVLDDLESDRALAGDDPAVIERRDDRQTALGRDRTPRVPGARRTRDRRSRSLRHRRPRARA